MLTIPAGARCSASLLKVTKLLMNDEAEVNRVRTCYASRNLKEQSTLEVGIVHIAIYVNIHPYEFGTN